MLVNLTFYGMQQYVRTDGTINAYDYNKENVILVTHCVFTVSPPTVGGETVGVLHATGFTLKGESDSAVATSTGTTSGTGTSSGA